MSFVHLHTHTHYSMQSSPIFPDALFGAVAAAGMDCVAVTDYCAMFNMPELFSEAARAGVRLVMGSELLLLDDGVQQQRRGPQASSLVVLVKNEVGYRNLCRILSRASREHFVQGMPHVDDETLAACCEGLVALSGWSAGRVGRALLAGDGERAASLAAGYRELFGDDFFLEVQQHGVWFDRQLFEQSVELGRALSIGLVATNNVHYLKREDAESYRAMVANRTKEKLSNPNLQAHGGNQFYLKSPEEMGALFSDAYGELSASGMIAERCRFSFSDKEPALPRFPLPEGFSSEEEFLRHLTWEGAREKYADPEADGLTESEVRERIELELGVIGSMGFSSYFLIVSDLIAASRRMGYSVGPGRGSAAGSIIAYLTGITRIDPLKYRLLFERFLNPERLSMPDIDIDFTPVGKQKVLEYTVEKYGASSVAKVVAIGTFGAKAAIRDAGRVLEVPLPQVDRLAKLVPSKPGITLRKALEESRELKEYAGSTPQLRALMVTAQAIEGRARNVSMHAGAVVITDGPLEDQVPLYVSNKIETEVRQFADELDLDLLDQSGRVQESGDEKQVVTQFDKNWIETAGLLKIDYLGLETLAVTDETVRLIKRRHGVSIELEALPMEDHRTFRIFQEGKMAGIFQFESSGMQSYMTRLRPTQIGDIIAMSALYRPGALNARIDEKRNAVDLFVDRKHGREAIDYMHPMLEGILRETYGVIVYQEQVMQISQVMGGFSLAKADNLRKAMGKKKPEIMEKFKADFVAGAIAQGVHDTLATRVFELMAEFAGYGFNKSHSAAYGVLAYWTGYLKAHYTIEFMTAVLNSEIGDVERMKHLTDEARSFGIETLPPSVNVSDALFSVEELPDGRSAIRVGLSAIKQVGSAARAIVTSRLRRGKPFGNLFELASSVDLRLVNRKALECLILAGALDEIEPHRGRLLASVDRAVKFGQLQNRVVTTGQGDFFANEQGELSDDMVLPELEQAPEMPEAEKLFHEKKLVGFYLSRHPLSAYRRDWKAFVTLPLHSRDVEPSRQYRVMGVVVSVKPHQDRKGKQMLFGTIEDFGGKADFTMFASLFEQVGHLVKPEEVLMLVVEAEVGGGMLKLLVREVVPVRKVRESFVRKVVLTVDADDESQLERLAAVHKVLGKSRGDTALEFEVRAQSGGVVEQLRLFARSASVEPSDVVLDRLEQIMGADNVRLSG